jgi:hypothetical protein
MGQSAKSVLALVVLLALAAGALGWLTSGVGGYPGATPWLRATPLVGIPALALLVFADFRREKLPNFLRTFGGYFERDGLCFVILPATDGQRFWWTVAFQNRYERPCRTHLTFRPAVPSFGWRRPQIAEARVEITCEGAAFGTVEISCALPLRYQGKRLRFEVAAATTYPAGRGSLLRYREGMRVGRRQKGAADTALMTVAGLTGHLHYTQSASFLVQLPRIGADTEAAGAPRLEIRWRPGDVGPVTWDPIRDGGRDERSV